jgi:hypothetical protein
MAVAGIPRRNVLLALAGGAVAAGGIGLWQWDGGMPPDISDTLEHPEANLLDWPAAFGFTLVPFGNAAHFALWTDVWDGLPAEKEKWLERFRDTVDAPPIMENLPRFEAAIVRMFGAFPNQPWKAFLDLAYKKVFDRSEFVELVFVDGAYQIGQADPWTLAEWGIPVPGIDAPDAE